MSRILITGGANGLGKALADHYLDEGAMIDILDVQVKDSMDRLHYFPFDLSRFDSSQLEKLSDPYDIIICNAGISVSGNFREIPFEKERAVMEINCLGHIQLVKHLLQKQLVKDNGKIVFIVSASEFFPFPIALSYSASKSALDGFARALESFVVDKNISVTRVYPGPMNTDHKRYYPGAQEEGGRLPAQSVPAIVKAIEKRKRKVYPDPVSKAYYIASKFVPGYLVKKAHSFYRDRM